MTDALQKYPENFGAASHEYSQRLLPFAEDVQAQAVKFGLEMFVPRSAEGIQRRNTRLGIGSLRLSS